MRPDDTLLGLTFLLSQPIERLFPLFFPVDSPVSGRKKEEREISEHRRFQSARGRYEGVTRYIETGDDVGSRFFSFSSPSFSLSPSLVSPSPLIREHKRPRDGAATTIPFDCPFGTTATATNVDRTLSRVTGIKKKKEDAKGKKMWNYRKCRRTRKYVELRFLRLRFSLEVSDTSASIPLILLCSIGIRCQR